MTESNQARGASRAPLAEPEDTELNMTPMIDIVFQLIVFFLLTLKFKTVDRRIDAMLPHDRGPAMTPRTVEDELRIKVKVFRRGVEDPDRAYTLVKVDNAQQFKLPEGWRGRTQEATHPERLRSYDAVVAAVQAEIHKRLAIYGGQADKIRGEISAPMPRGGAVPHGDVISMLNAFLREGITDVKFEGTLTPLNRQERAARAAAR
jgi:biopolymer transport protein ExbD